MPARHYAKLSKLAAEAADSWQSVRTSTRMPVNEHVRYTAAADQLLTDITRTLPLNGQEVVRTPAPHGLRVLFRTCHIAVALAKRDAMPMDELVGALRQDESFDPLDVLLTKSLTVTRAVEEELGIVPYAYPLDDWTLSRWDLDSGALRVEGMDRLVDEKREYLEPGRPQETIKGCGAHHAKIMQSLFHSSITICERDENLFARSLS